jgi:D-threonate/D-erythronate kinase
MLIVFADDFSGAAEIAGIAHSYGLLTHVQKQYVATNCDVLIIDMDTRSKSAQEASKIAELISNEVAQNKNITHIFKKIDSVFRGHIRDEIIQHLHAFTFRRVLVMANNPCMSRYIRDGQYYINDVLVHESTFSTDPDFPHKNSNVKEMLAWQNELPYYHLSLNEVMPKTPCICTSDVIELNCLEKRVEHLTPQELLCGSGDAFRVYIKTFFESKSRIGVNIRFNNLLFVNGSTYINAIERNILEENNLPIMFWQNVSDNDSYKLMLDTNNASIKLALYSKKNENDIYHYSLQDFAQFVVNLLAGFKGTLHLIICGGATASAIMKLLKFTTFDVVREVSAGVVTLKSLTNENIFITTKPGSYPWKEDTIKDICNSIDPL